jgi:RNA polymerase sigma-70 factor (ECF subfamily)
MADFRTLTDEQLAGECQAGSLSAFEELVRRHEMRLFHFLCQKMRSREDAQDTAQTTFITAWQRIGQYRTKAKFATWLYTIARNLTISHYRKHGRVHLCELECTEAELVGTQTPAHELSTGEEHDHLWRVARVALRNDSYDILWFKYQEGLTIVEIATLMKRSNTAVKVMLHRARKTLGRALKVEETPEPSKAPVAPELAFTNC